MTTHVFIVDDTTFKYHLEYMFAGCGAKEKVVDFNNMKYMQKVLQNGMLLMKL